MLRLETESGAWPESVADAIEIVPCIELHAWLSRRDIECSPSDRLDDVRARSQRVDSGSGMRSAVDGV